MAKPKDAMSLSFLDVLSCSLGGMILLFLIFSTLNHQGDRSSQSREGIDKPTTRMIPSRDLGTEEQRFPILFEVTLTGLDGSAGNLSSIGGDESWATITRDPTTENGPKSTWYVFVENTKGAEGKEIVLEPADTQFRVCVRTITGFTSEDSEPVVAAPVKANEPRLRFAMNTLTVRSR